MRVRRVSIAAFVACWMFAVSAAAAAADQVIFVVRHGERADQPGGAPPATPMMANDPPLSAAGRERANRLAALLAAADVKHVFATEFLRTQQTAAPAAQKAGVQVTTSPSKDTGLLLQQILKSPGAALVVGHSNTVPDVLKGLGVKTPIAIADTEFDNLFIVVRPAAGEPTLIRLRY
jgi:phosphohistidine phosphatase SixA